MIGIVRAFVIGIVVGLTVALFQSGKVFWGELIIILAFIFIFDLLASMNKKSKVLPAYRIRLSVCPNWEAILSVTAKDGVINKKNIIRNILEDPELEIDEEWSLLGKEFRYAIFTDEASGMTQVWSYSDKCFVDELEVHGSIIHGNLDKIRQKYNINEEALTGRGLVIRPWEMGYAHQYAPDIDIDQDRMLSEIPYGYIIQDLKKLHAVWGDAMKGILKFPDDLQKKFTEHGVKYETWDNQDWGTGLQFSGKPADPKYTKNVKKIGFEISDDGMRSHGFSTKYCSIYINIEFFDRGEA